ncbi:methyl-accepting chemotaxis protein [Ammoniphilus resinae]|uniref:Methyl-accepting chemotaxis protein n=1 Tax=Ammoniphilus resinae TaxID=861532 RepID=A0ABS4GWN3_9BACL|nr:methyl-accepting chemotaxis protein [Ammoniphilus resinae]MBP1934681.1 methyl-accepting chemotaxis protein [Ammoniphilus resinae]
MNLFTKILISVLGTCFIIFGSVLGFTLYKTSTFAVDYANQLAIAEGEKQAKKVDAELDFTMDTTRMLASNFAVMVQENKADRELANSMLKKALEENKHFLGTWTAWEPNAFDGKDGEFAGTLGHDTTGRFIPYWTKVDGKVSVEGLKGYDQQGEGDYYQLAKESGKEVILEPYAYEVGGREVLMTSIVSPIKINGKVVGAVGVDISLDFLQEINSTIKLYETGFGAIVSHQGIIVAHKLQDLVGKSNYEIPGLRAVDQIKNAVESGQTASFIDFSPVTQGDVYKVYSPIFVGNTTTPWSLLVSIPEEEVKKESNQLLTLSILMGAVGTILLGIVIFFIARALVRPIHKTVEQINQMAKGNLRVEKLEIKSKDEIAQLANAMNEMTENMRVLIQDAAGISDQVAASSEELIASTNEIKLGIEQVSATTEELAAGSTEQAQLSNDTFEKIQHVDQEMKQINQHTEKMTIRSKRTEESSYKGIESAEQSMQQMKMIEEKVATTAMVVKELGEKSKEINQILQVINDIAAQTNLLSLNAAIEAARAGEQGKGFAVVANEVRLLATQAAESTGKIGKIIDAVQKETLEAEQSMNGVVQAVQRGSQAIVGNRRAFDEIAQNVADMVKQMKEVNEASKRIEQENQEAVQAVENIAAISQQSSAGSEELSATMEQQNAAMQEIDGMANNLSEMAEALHQSLSKFKY